MSFEKYCAQAAHKELKNSPDSSFHLTKPICV